MSTNKSDSFFRQQDNPPGQSAIRCTNCAAVGHRPACSRVPTVQGRAIRCSGLLRVTPHAAVVLVRSYTSSGSMRIS